MSLDVRLIGKSLGLLQIARPNVFGATGHHFRLNPTIDESDVRAFEDAQGIQLPEDYRTFLISVGNGGAGPSYGVFELGTMTDPGHNCGSWRDEVGNLPEPFPYSLERIGGRSDDPAGLFVIGPHGYKMSYHYDVSPNEHADDEWHIGPVNGAIPICHGGCGCFYWLVLSGNDRGHIWYDERVAALGFKPLLNGSGLPIGFADWYQEWLKESLSAVA